MPINKNALQARINNISKETGVHQNVLLKSFFFDAFLKRLSASAYADHFVFKGGFLLSSALGIALRSTMDIDFLIRQMPLDEETVSKAMKEVIAMEVGDKVKFGFRGIESIRQEDEYGGYRVTIMGRLENIKETVTIDIATGDPVVPDAVDYQYRCLFGGEVLHFRAYNFETILAEKLQTVLARGVLNSRSKDFFDLYIIHQLRWREVDERILKEAFSSTCRYRNTLFTASEANGILNQIKGDSQMEQRWNSYRRKNAFVGDVTFQDAVNAAFAVAYAACSN